MDILAAGPDESSFAALAASGYNRIPVWMQVQASLDSPFSLYHRLARGSDSALLESGTTDSDIGRYSVICPTARYRLEVRGQHVRVLDRGRISERGVEPDPLAWVQAFWSRFRVARQALPPGTHSWGGLYGYFSYDTVRYLEPRLADGREGKPGSPVDIPDICQLLCDELVVLDHRVGRILLLVYADPGEQSWQSARERLDELASQLTDSDRDPEPFIPVEEGDQTASDVGLEYGFERAAFDEALQRIRAYTRAGDCMQVVLGSVFSGQLGTEPLSLYRSLREVNPSPYMYFFDFGEFQIAGASPEELVRLDGRRILLRPLAGTRRRGRDAAEDQALEREMLEDPKEMAEHLMLVDLGRNDVGRVAEVGSVEVQEYMAVRRYRQVMHLAATVTGTIRDGLDAFDLLRATFPAGTLSGAPKVRAMEIIDELEPLGRGLYGGSVGCIDYDGNLRQAIAIRTAVLKDGEIFIGAGAGIVADSVADLEWREVHNKARAMVRALARTRGVRS